MKFLKRLQLVTAQTDVEDASAFLEAIIKLPEEASDQEKKEAKTIIEHIGMYSFEGIFNGISFLNYSVDKLKLIKEKFNKNYKSPTNRYTAGSNEIPGWDAINNVLTFNLALKSEDWDYVKTHNATTLSPNQVSFLFEKNKPLFYELTSNRVLPTEDIIQKETDVKILKEWFKLNLKSRAKMHILNKLSAADIASLPNEPVLTREILDISAKEQKPPSVMETLYLKHIFPSFAKNKRSWEENWAIKNSILPALFKADKKFVEDVVTKPYYVELRKQAITLLREDKEFLKKLLERKKLPEEVQKHIQKYLDSDTLLSKMQRETENKEKALIILQSIVQSGSNKEAIRHAILTFCEMFPTYNTLGSLSFTFDLGDEESFKILEYVTLLDYSKFKIDYDNVPEDELISLTERYPKLPWVIPVAYAGKESVVKAWQPLVERFGDQVIQVGNDFKQVWLKSGWVRGEFKALVLEDCLRTQRGFDATPYLDDVATLVKTEKRIPYLLKAALPILLKRKNYSTIEHVAGNNSEYFEALPIHRQLKADVKKTNKGNNREHLGTDPHFHKELGNSKQVPVEDVTLAELSQHSFARKNSADWLYFLKKFDKYLKTDKKVEYAERALDTPLGYAESKEVLELVSKKLESMHSTGNLDEKAATEFFINSPVVVTNLPVAFDNNAEARDKLLMFLKEGVSLTTATSLINKIKNLDHITFDLAISLMSNTDDLNKLDRLRVEIKLKVYNLLESKVQDERLIKNVAYLKNLIPARMFSETRDLEKLGDETESKIDVYSTKYHLLRLLLTHSRAA